MVASSSPPDAALPVSPLTARKTWRTVEPLHGMVYFAPEVSQAYARLGIGQEAGYFASRAAPMGAVSADTVIAAFYSFSPRLVRAAIPAAWVASSPAVIIEARLAAADAALRRLLGDAVDSSEMARAAELAKLAAVRATERIAGRPLFAGHAGLPWPDSPHLVLWHAQTLLREFRGDGHIAALLLADIGPMEALVMHVASGEMPPGFLQGTRGWSDAEWATGVEQVTEREWVEGSAAAGDGLALTGTGRTVRQGVEDHTDRLAVFPYEAIGEDGCDELRSLARPFSHTVVATGGFRT